MNGWYSTGRRMNFIKFVVMKRLPECLASVINVFLNTGKKSEAGRERCVMGSVVADLAALSAVILPLIPECPGIQQKIMS